MQMIISTNDLLDSGWHGIYNYNKQFWAHLDYCIMGRKE